MTSVWDVFLSSDKANQIYSSAADWFSHLELSRDVTRQIVYFMLFVLAILWFALHLHDSILMVNSEKRIYLSTRSSIFCVIEINSSSEAWVSRCRANVYAIKRGETLLLSSWWNMQIRKMQNLKSASSARGLFYDNLDGIQLNFVFQLADSSSDEALYIN